MTIQAVPAPELSPSHCLVCHAHRAQFWVSLNVDLLDGHAYLCSDCANGVTHAVGGLTSDKRQELAAKYEELMARVNELTGLLARAEAETIRVVSVDEIVPYVKRAPGRPVKEPSAA